MLGFDIQLEFERLFGPGAVFGFTRQTLDITSQAQIDRTFADLKPTLVINAAAYTNVDAAETDRAAALEVNARGPSLLADACRRLGAKLVHFSTDQVFDGESKRPWLESDKPKPLNYYATTKLAGERAALGVSNAVVLRVQWLYGRKKERFTQLKTQKVFTPFSDQWGAPTWTCDVARRLAQICEHSGLFHFAYDDHACWAEVFEFVKDTLVLNVELRPRATSEVPLPARRPLYCVLSNQKLRRALGCERLGSWKDALSEFLKNLSR